MRIALAVNGEGHGHAARSACLARRLQRDHTVVVWSPPTVLPFLREHIPGAAFHYLPVLRLVKRAHRIRILPTIASNAGLALSVDRVARRLRRHLLAERIDGVVSDYEPFLSRAGLSLHLPVVIFCHQAVLDRIPDYSGDGILARLLNRFMMPTGAGATISSSFFEGDVGPLIRPELTERAPHTGNHILVYGSASIRNPLTTALDGFPDEDFRVYPNSSGNFIDDFRTAKAVIGPAGHQMLSETLCLGKPVLTFPQPRQNEQWLNARMAARTGLALVGRIESAESDIADFISRFDSVPFVERDSSVRFTLADDTDRAAECVHNALALPGGRISAGRALGAREAEAVPPAFSLSR